MPPRPSSMENPVYAWFTVEKGETLFKISHNTELPSLFRIYSHMIHGCVRIKENKKSN